MNCCGRENERNWAPHLETKKAKPKGLTSTNPVGRKRRTDDSEEIFGRGSKKYEETEFARLPAYRKPMAAITTWESECAGGNVAFPAHSRLAHQLVGKPASPALPQSRSSFKQGVFPLFGRIGGAIR
jgi:hypothetical protein